MSRLLVGFDSAWTVKNAGGLVGIVCQDEGDHQDLGPPVSANFALAEEMICEWQRVHVPSETILLIDQPTIVNNRQGQRPVENLVSSPVSLRYGGMQPAYTGRTGMFDLEAPIWSFLRCFGDAREPLSPTNRSIVFETYPVLAIIALGWTLPDQQRKERLPKYNPARRRTFHQNDWEHLCIKIIKEFQRAGLENIKGWIDSRRERKPTKGDQDCLDACLCLLVAMHIANGEPCLTVGQRESGEIVVPYSKSLEDELLARCIQTGRKPDEWLRRLPVCR